MTSIDANTGVEDLDRNDVYDNQNERFENENKKTINEKQREKEELSSTETITWKEISETLDRICLYLYALLVVMLIVIFTITLNGA